jgi:NAD-dependent dihydropyrimidine dehydrogenase PreA subunit
MTCVTTEPCIGIKARDRVAVCPVDRVQAAGDHFMIDPEVQVGCGAREPECPVEAVRPEDEVPEEMRSHIAKAAGFDRSRTNRARADIARTPGWR